MCAKTDIGLTSLLAVLMLAACSSIGPGSVERDRFDYNGAVARSWKEQTLLNIVKGRYMDMPVFLDISQVVGSYTLSGTASLGYATTVASGPAALGDIANVGVTGTWSDRPTITYTPVTGAQFNKNLLTPIPPSAVLFMVEAGWPIDLVWGLTVQGINGLEATGPTTARYERLLALLRALQVKEGIGMRVKKGKGPEETTTVFFKGAAGADAALDTLRREAEQLLGMPRGRSEYIVIYGLQPGDEGELAILTRSMLQILLAMGSAVEVPEADLRQGRAIPAPLSKAHLGRVALHIKYSEKRPAEACASVPYRAGWYWIDDRDLDSKRTFALIMLFFTLSETGGREGLPLVTIPAG